MTQAHGFLYQNDVLFYRPKNSFEGKIIVSGPNSHHIEREDDHDTTSHKALFSLRALDMETYLPFFISIIAFS